MTMTRSRVELSQMSLGFRLPGLSGPGKVLVTWESPQAEWSSQYNPLANLGIRVLLTS